MVRRSGFARRRSRVLDSGDERRELTGRKRVLKLFGPVIIGAATPAAACSSSDDIAACVSMEQRLADFDVPGLAETFDEQKELDIQVATVSDEVQETVETLFVGLCTDDADQIASRLGLDTRVLADSGELSDEDVYVNATVFVRTRDGMVTSAGYAGIGSS